MEEEEELLGRRRGRRMSYIPFTVLTIPNQGDNQSLQHYSLAQLQWRLQNNNDDIIRTPRATGGPPQHDPISKGTSSVHERWITRDKSYNGLPKEHGN